MELLTANSPLLTGPLVIGRFYSVPSINALVWNLGMTPIIGPLHEDKEHIGFDDLHWHIDWRFVSAWQLSRLSGSGRIPVQAKVISQKNTAGQIVERRLKCKREMPEFPLRPYGKMSCTGWRIWRPPTKIVGSSAGRSAPTAVSLWPGVRSMTESSSAPPTALPGMSRAALW